MTVQTSKKQEEREKIVRNNQKNVNRMDVSLGIVEDVVIIDDNTDDDDKNKNKQEKKKRKSKESRKDNNLDKIHQIVLILFLLMWSSVQLEMIFLTTMNQ